MAVTVYGGGNIANGALPGSEGSIATIAANPTSAKVRVHGHVICQCSSTAGTVTLRLRQGSVTGNIVYINTVSHVSSEQKAIPFEVEDDSGWITQANPGTNGLYVLTAADSGGTGLLNGGTIYLESVP
jgi:hypothetical protein